MTEEVNTYTIQEQIDCQNRIKEQISIDINLLQSTIQTYQTALNTLIVGNAKIDATILNLQAQNI